MDNNNNRSSLGTGTIIKIAIFVAFLIIAGILLSTLTPTLFPPQASLEAQNVDNLFNILLFLGGIVFFLIQGLLVISVIAFRAKPGDTSDGPSTHGNMTLEIVWTIVPSLVVVFLAIVSFNVWQQNTTPKENENVVNGEPIDINVVGARYAWSHSYTTNIPNPNEDGEPVILSSGTTLHTYIGQNVNLTLQTQDVIHSYWVPAMRVKQDLLPGNPDEGGRPTELRFTPVEVEGIDPGDYPVEYPLVCAELCGDGHGRMIGTVKVYQNEDQFLDMFFDSAVDAVLNPPADPVLRAPNILEGYACNGCHVLDDLGWAGLTGPSLNGIADRAGERVSGQSAEEYLVTSIWNSGVYLAPGYQNLMPVFGPDQPGANEMNAEELYSIVAYLCTQGDDSDCDNENNTTVIPEAINSLFNVEVDVDFGQSGEASSASGVDLSILDPIYNAGGEDESAMEEATQEPEVESESTEEASE